MINKNSELITKKIFEESCVVTVNIDTRYKILWKLTDDIKDIFKKISNLKKKYVKNDFSSVIFSDEYRAVLEGCSGWSGGLELT